MKKLFDLLRAAPDTIPASLYDEVEADLHFLQFWSAHDRARLRTRAGEFLACKEFAGAHGFEVDDATRLSIALQASLPVLELGIEAYEGWVGIVVYPGDFVVPQREVGADGVVHEYAQPMLGQAWDKGPVLLAWHDDPADYHGAAVVIHEFAHKLDMANGLADGLPPLHADMSRQAWYAAFEPAYRHFVALLEQGLPTPFDAYAATHPCEFFAVASEVFFTSPDRLAASYPQVYAQMSLFYRQDPLAGQRAWQLEARRAVLERWR